MKASPTVLKFGGTSMGSTESLQQVAEIIQEKHQQGKIVVVCSAMAGVTDLLIKALECTENQEESALKEILAQIEAKHFQVIKDLSLSEAFEAQITSLFQQLRRFLQGLLLIQEVTEKSRAWVLSFGERLSTRLLAEILRQKNVVSQQLDTDFIITQGKNFLEDQVDFTRTKSAVEAKLLLELSLDKVPILTGFFGKSTEGITLLGRGGSDYSAAIIAYSLGWKRVEIWTDVDGFLTADPRIVPTAKVIEEMGFLEASELCFFGAKVLHPRTIRPVIELNGEVWIKNTFNPKAHGTRIVRSTDKNTSEVLAISSKPVLLISLDLFASQLLHKEVILKTLFQLTAEHHIPIEAIAASETTVSFCIEPKYNGFLPILVKTFQERFGITAEIRDHRAVVCIVSPENTLHTYGILGKIFQAVGEAKVSVEMDSQNASEVAQVIVVQESSVKSLIKTIHQRLIVG